MFKQLLDAWRGKDILSKMFDELVQMIEDDEWMFRAVCDVLFGHKPGSELAEELYERDIRVNKTERKIRRQIVEHLAVRPGTEVPSCLVLMSVVKDAERIGDYCKNIFEVASMYTMNFDHGRYITPLQETRTRIESLFTSTRNAFMNSDPDEARKVVSEA